MNKHKSTLIIQLNVQQLSIFYVYFIFIFIFLIVLYCYFFPSYVQLAMRGPTGPMGLTGRPGPLVCISNHLTASLDTKSIEIVCQKIWSAVIVVHSTQNEYKIYKTVCSWVENLYWKLFFFPSQGSPGLPGLKGESGEAGPQVRDIKTQNIVFKIFFWKTETT